MGEIPDASVVNYTVFQDKIYYTMEDIRTDGNYQFSVWQMSLDGKEKKQIWQGDCIVDKKGHIARNRRVAICK